MRMIDLIAKKRLGQTHTPEELAFIVQAAASADSSVPDYQLSAWLMAVCCRGMKESETVALTRLMARAGPRLDFKSFKAPKVDKHSTGGVGDGISLALAPLVASAGLMVPMMSGRGLGHTGGTLDKLESVRGFKVFLEIEEIRQILAKVGVVMFGQTKKLAPADRKLYALRDATSTVESLPLIVASILSKKFAEDLNALVLDVKVGSGAIFRKPQEAMNLSKALVKTAKLLGLRTVAVLTAMEQPLGRYVGNALEMRQAVEVLRGDFTSSDYVECLMALGGWMVHLGGKAKTPKEAQAKLYGLIRSGAALEKFKQMISSQGGDPRFADNLELLPKAARSCEVLAPRTGVVSVLEARKIGEAAVILGAGRASMEQSIDYGAGIILEKKIGDVVRQGDCVARLYAGDDAKLKEAQAYFLQALRIESRAKKPKSVILKILK